MEFFTSGVLFKVITQYNLFDHSENGVVIHLHWSLLPTLKIHLCRIQSWNISIFKSRLVPSIITILFFLLIVCTMVGRWFQWSLETWSSLGESAVIGTVAKSGNVLIDLIWIIFFVLVEKCVKLISSRVVFGKPKLLWSCNGFHFFTWHDIFNSNGHSAHGVLTVVKELTTYFKNATFPRMNIRESYIIVRSSSLTASWTNTFDWFFIVDCASFCFEITGFKATIGFTKRGWVKQDSYLNKDLKEYL